MIGYTRIEVAGTVRRVDLVVPDDESLGTVLPRIITLLDEPRGTVARPFTLVGVDGEQIDLARTPTQQNLPDGSALRLLRLDAAPPPPVVIDLADTAAAAHDAHEHRWGQQGRDVASAVGIGLAAALGGVLLPVSAASAHLAAVLGAALTASVAALVFGLARRARVARLWTAMAAGLAVPVALDAMVLADVEYAWAVGAAAALTEASVVLLIALGAARREPGATAGGAVGLITGAGLLALLISGMRESGAAAIVGTVAVFAVGVLPWAALSAAGMTGLDQSVADGRRVPHGRAADAVVHAYRALTWGAAACATVIAVSGALLVAVGGIWPNLLAAAFAVAAALRARSLPLQEQVWAVWGAVAVIAVAAALRVGLAVGGGWAAVAGCAAVIVAVGAAALVSPRPHQRARLRSLGNTIELLTVVALVPLTLGLFGVYGELLALYGGDG